MRKRFPVRPIRLVHFVYLHHRVAMEYVQTATTVWPCTQTNRQTDTPHAHPGKYHALIEAKGRHSTRVRHR